MKKLIFLLFFLSTPVFAATAGIPISVPSATSSGYILVSQNNGRYIASSTNGSTFGWIHSTSSTASTFTGGLSTLGAIDMNSQLINNLADPVSLLDAVNLQTLQSAVGIDYQWYMSNSASADIGGYKLLSTTNDASQNTLTVDGTSSGQVLDEWVTLVNTPGAITISEGEVSVHFYAKVAGTASTDFLYQIRTQVYKRTGAVETQLGTDADSLPTLTTSTTLYSTHTHLTEPLTLVAGDRIVVKLSTVRTGTAPRVNAQVVTLYVGATTPSHVALPTTLAVLGNYLPIAGGTMTGDIIMQNSSEIGIATTSPTSRLSIDGYTNDPTKSILTIGTSTSGTATSTALIIDGNGRVGIATTSPNAPLTVNGTTYLNGFLGIGLKSPVSDIEINSKANNPVITLSNNNDDQLKIGYNYISSQYGGNLMILRGYGNVQIATIADITSGTKYQFYADANSELRGSSGELTEVSVSPMINQSGTASYVALKVNTNETVAVGSGRHTLLDLQNNGTPKFSVNSSGWLSIGRDTGIPKYAVDVTGEGVFSSFLDASYLKATSSNATSTFAGGLIAGIEGVNNEILSVNRGATKNSLYIPPAGTPAVRVGVGTTSPYSSNGGVGAVFNVYASSGNSVLRIDTSSTNDGQGGIWEIAGGRQGNETRLGQLNVRYNDSEGTDSEFLFEVNNGTGLISGLLISSDGTVTIDNNLNAGGHLKVGKHFISTNSVSIDCGDSTVNYLAGSDIAGIFEFSDTGDSTSCTIEFLDAYTTNTGNNEDVVCDVNKNKVDYADWSFTTDGTDVTHIVFSSLVDLDVIQYMCHQITS